MTTSTSRRAVLAGIAAAPAIGAPAVAAIGADPDPVFAAIERHRVAFLWTQETGQVVSNTNDYDERMEVRSAVEEKAISVFDDVSLDLLNLARTASPAGLVALLGYVEAFNRGALVHDPDYGSSMPMHWPCIGEFEFEHADDHGGAAFAWSLLDSIRENLASKAVAS